MQTVRTDIDMINSGQWAKVAKKHYRHASGVEIKYDCNAWVWEAIGGKEDGHCWTQLNHARWSVERALK